MLSPAKSSDDGRRWSLRRTYGRPRTDAKPTWRARGLSNSPRTSAAPAGLIRPRSEALRSCARRRALAVVIEPGQGADEGDAREEVSSGLFVAGCDGAK